MNEEQERAAAVLFNQIIDMFLGPDPDLEQPMNLDKVQGTFDWDGMHFEVKAYRMFDRRKGHTHDMVRVDLRTGGFDASKKD